jgi:hypothetical protein
MQVCWQLFGNQVRVSGPQALADMETYLTQADPSDENWPDAQRIVRLLRDPG